MTTVRCGKTGTAVLYTFGLGSDRLCFGIDGVDNKTVVTYPCPYTSISCDNNITGKSRIPKC
jgi:hypothetical protein